MDLTKLDFTRSTPLCRLMEKYGSDKGRDDIVNWKHNYTLVYTKLFEKFQGRAIRLFELGLGTNNVLLPSTMAWNGIPGGSLRAWEEYFPQADIYGADIDRDILFSVGRIQTYYCDQTNLGDIFAMWAEPALQDAFDIIIEDGLHTFEANVCFFENSVHKLAAGGIYVIEDITRPDLPRFTEKIREWEGRFAGFTFQLLDLPCSVNSYDNILLVATKAG
jgi:SAM-dependent methyltransferase